VALGAIVSGDIAALLQEAFNGVTLGDGMSLRHAQFVDRYGEVPLDTSDPSANVVDNWRRIPLRELERDCVAHLDAAGLRYYIPALCISVLEHFDPASMRVIGTLRALYPKKDSWPYHMERYRLLDGRQKEALAVFLSELPFRVELDLEDKRVTERALRNYWSNYLPKSASDGA
jgi:hypothetical protein